MDELESDKQEKQESPEEQRLKKIGLLPGSPVYLGEKSEVKPKLIVISYDKNSYYENVIDIREKSAFENELKKLLKKKPFVNWVIFIGVNNIDILQKLGEFFNLHALTIEDIANTHQRPKIESYDNYIYIVGKILGYESFAEDINHEQISIVISKNTLISFHETEHQIIETIRHRIEKNRGEIRKRHVDYLAYSIFDVMIDKYFELLEKLSEVIEELEEEVIKNPNIDIIIKVEQIKRKIIMLRRILWPSREVINKFSSPDFTFVKKSTRFYLRDVHDHIIQVLETIETYRDVLASMIDIYLSSINNKINEVIKVLTIITTIFIPLTFITSVYGMNFKYMPELEWQYGYYAVWAVLFLIAVFMVLFFKRKGWL
ncbi:MAG: magnesium/cobalt transporter CorA [Candidatus Anstonellales archaeon]